MDIDLLYAFSLPPEEAVKYFASKGYTFSWDWWEVWQEAHDKAFTVAKVMRMDILQDIRAMVQKAIEEGITFEQFRKELEPRLKAKGWWGKQLIGDESGGFTVQLGSVWRLLTIYETNLQTAYMTGRYAAFMDNAAQRPYWQYVAVMDSRTRPEHAVLHGKVFRFDDPFWDVFYPPNGWRCRCRVRALSGKNLRERGLWPSESEGRMGSREMLVSKKTGEMADVGTYTDPTTGFVVHPDPGWSYNPGKSRYVPGLDKYDDDIKKAGL